MLRVCTAKKALDIQATIACSGCIIIEPPVNRYWLYIRGFFCCYIAFVFVWAIWYASTNVGFGYFFLYMTDWVLMLNLLYFILVFLVTKRVYQVYAPDVSNNPVLPSLEDVGIETLFKVTKNVYQTGLASSILVVLYYWTLVYDPNRTFRLSYMAVNAHTHGITCVFMIVEYFMSAYELQYQSVKYPIGLALTYAIFTLLYYACGGTDNNGNHYIYSSLRWGGNAGAAIGVVVMLIVVVALLHCALVALKNWILIRWIHKRGVSGLDQLVSNPIEISKALSCAKDIVGDVDNASPDDPNSANNNTTFDIDLDDNPLPQHRESRVP